MPNPSWASLHPEGGMNSTAKGSKTGLTGHKNRLERFADKGRMETVSFWFNGSVSAI